MLQHVTRSATAVFFFLNGGCTEGLDNDIEGWDIGAGVKAMW